MDTLRCRLPAFICLSILVSSALTANEQLVYDEPLGCNGDRFIVSYCRGDSDAGDYVTNPLDNYCKVTYVDRPRTNGFLPETGELRGEILKKLVACKSKSGQTASREAAGYLSAGRAWLEKDDKDRARTELVKVLALKAATSDELIPAGDLLAQAGDEKSATEAYRRGVQLPGEPAMLARGWLGFGRAQQAAARNPQAIAALNEAIRLDPNNADAHWVLAAVYGDQGDFAHALAARQAVVRLKPNDEWAQYLLGGAYAAQKQVTPALAAYERVLTLAPKNSLGRDLLSLLSNSYAELERPEEAIAAMRAALAIPDDGTVDGIEAKVMQDFSNCRRLGELLVEQKHYPEVVRQNFARGSCNSMMGPGELGVAYVALEQPAKAIPQLEAALKGFEKSIADSTSELASPMLKKEERESLAESLADLKADSTRDLYALGRAYQLTGRAADAGRTARTLQKYDAKLGAKLSAEVGSAH